jgi:hypothetical protein
MRLRSNVVGAAVKKDGENAIIAVVPGEIDLPADKPHTLTFSARGYEDGTATLTPHCSHGLAVGLIVSDILSIPILIGVFNLVFHSIRIASDPIYPGVYDQDEVFVELKPTEIRSLNADVDVKKEAREAPVPPKAAAPTAPTAPTAPQSNPQAPTKRFCSSCGVQIAPEARFCPSCGAAK